MVIIGVIAAITVPSLINKTNNQETVSKLKKAYSVMAQATNQIIAEEGPATNWVTTPEFVYELYRKKLLNAKECGTEIGCMTQSYKHLHKGDTPVWHLSDSYRRLVLADGVQIMFDPDIYSLCDKSSIDSTNYCARFYIDINGEKKPNIHGRDVFSFVLKKQGLYPRGCEDDNECDSGYGWECTCRVLREGAINY